MAVQARQADARSHLAQVWAIDDVPRFGQGDPAEGMSGAFAAFKWIGVTKPQVLLLVKWLVRLLLV